MENTGKNQKRKPTMSNIKIWTDGACSKNGRRNSIGGYGYLFSKEGCWFYGCGNEEGTTNQRMELIAVIKALQALNIEKIDFFTMPQVTIYTDSAYIVNCFEDKWWVKWISNGWVNSKKEPVANQDLWSSLIQLYQAIRPTFVKVKGHSSNVGNQIADSIACVARIRGYAFDSIGEDTILFLANEHKMSNSVVKTFLKENLNG